MFLRYAASAALPAFALRLAASSSWLARWKGRIALARARAHGDGVLARLIRDYRQVQKLTSLGLQFFFFFFLPVIWVDFPDPVPVGIVVFAVWFGAVANIKVPQSS